MGDLCSVGRPDSQRAWSLLGCCGLVLLCPSHSYGARMEPLKSIRAASAITTSAPCSGKPQFLSQHGCSGIAGVLGLGMGACLPHVGRFSFLITDASEWKRE